MPDASVSPLLSLGLLLVSGIGAGIIASRFGWPRVVVYLLVGVLYSPALLGDPLGIRPNAWTETITGFALGVVAYLIGGSITPQQLRRMGRLITGITVGQTLGAVAVVFLVLYFLAPTLPGLAHAHLALALAAIAATTAPAATVAVLHQYRARGPISDSLLGIVALDDVLGILVFSVLAVLSLGAPATTTLSTALLDVGGSLVIGTAAGLVLAASGKTIRQAGLRLPLILGMVLLVYGLAEILQWSALLACMTLGFVARWRLRAAGDRLFAVIEYFEEMIFVLFFVLAGLHFEPAVISGHLGLALLYVGARIAGKVGGAAVGARVVAAPRTVQRWAGLTLVPQAGVAVGLVLTLTQHPTFVEHSAVLLNVVLLSTLINEITGPLTTRFALQRAGELGATRKRTAP